jgi:hypothetical protein
MVLAVIFIMAIASTATIYSFFIRQPIDVSTEYEIYFDSAGVEDTVLTNWTINNATSNNVYEDSHTIELNNNSQFNYTVDFIITNDTELEVLVLTTSGDTGSAITSLLLDPGVQQTIYYYVRVLDKVSQGSYSASIEVT